MKGANSPKLVNLPRRSATAEQAPSPAPAPTRLQRTKALVKAFARLERAEAEIAAAKLAVDAAFRPWAVGRSISRDQAREQLASTGFLPETRRP